MKKVLITGANSYIGTSFEKLLRSYPDLYTVDTVDMIDGSWAQKSFAGYDAVFHVAGIAHQKETKENAHLYYEINRDLAVKTAEKAKSEGVKQFVFLSSMSVYGMDTGTVTKSTVPDPKTNYGKSKLEAEQRLRPLEDASFKICIIRPPMVYGEGCRGNYQSIVKIVEKFRFFPRIKNARSLIHIDNLTSFVRMCIDEDLGGLYFPQNRTPVSTMELASEIAEKRGLKLYFSYLLGAAVFCFRPFVRKLKKAFGSLIYSDTEDFDYRYCVR